MRNAGAARRPVIHCLAVTVSGVTMTARNADAGTYPAQEPCREQGSDIVGQEEQRCARRRGEYSGSQEGAVAHTVGQGRERHQREHGPQGVDGEDQRCGEGPEAHPRRPERVQRNRQRPTEHDQGVHRGHEPEPGARPTPVDGRNSLCADV